MLASLIFLIMTLCQAQFITVISAQPLHNVQSSDPNSFPVVVNVDGDLKAAISPQQRDIIWQGQYPDQPVWFSGNAGNSTLNMTYDFSSPDQPLALCDLQFVDANGNRPYPFMSTLNGAFPKLYLSQTLNVVVHFDIKLDEFAADPQSWLRMGVVVALQTDGNSERAYLEQDIKDSAQPLASLPVHCNDVSEIYFVNISIGAWMHLDVPFEDFMQNVAMQPSLLRSFMAQPNSTFIESVYLVNECFGSGHVRYSLANWWITAEKVGSI